MLVKGGTGIYVLTCKNTFQFSDVWDMINVDISILPYFLLNINCPLGVYDCARHQPTRKKVMNVSFSYIASNAVTANGSPMGSSTLAKKLHIWCVFHSANFLVMTPCSMNIYFRIFTSLCEGHFLKLVISNAVWSSCISLLNNTHSWHPWLAWG